MRFLLLVTGLTYAFILQVKAAPVNEYMQYLPNGANLALMVQKIGASSPIIDYHGKQMAIPASTMKVITTLAALLELGADYRFQTTFETKGMLVDGTLNGDLIVRFVGDPTLRRHDLRNMIAALKNQEIAHIKGNLVIDTSIFSSYDVAPGWPWNDMIQCFSTPPGAAIVDKNCSFVSLHSATTPGKNAFIRVKSDYPVHILSQVRTLAQNSDEGQYCELNLVPGELNRYTLTGCMQKRNNPLSLAFAVQDGVAWAGEILKTELNQAGIDYNGHLVRETRITKPGTVLTSIRSAPLRTLLHTMLKKSDNMIADTIFRTIGHHYFNVPGTFRAGSDAVRRILREKTNINLGNSIQVDGSGLSRHDLISPETMMQVLQYIAQNDSTLHYISMLPLAGYDGTLRYRGGLHEAGLDGKVFAKTGSLQGVYNLAGFITTSNGARIAFVQFLSGYALSPEDQRTLRVPLLRFESHLYNYINKNY